MRCSSMTDDHSYWQATAAGDRLVLSDCLTDVDRCQRLLLPQLPVHSNASLGCKKSLLDSKANTVILASLVG